MINLRNRKLISFKFHSTSSTPILPPSIISGKSLTGIIRINQFKGNKRRNKKQDGIGGNGNGGFSSSLLPPLKSNWKSGPPATDEYVNLFSIYGNILAKEPELLFRYKQSSGNEVEFINYPIDPSLLKLLESSVKFWYENAGKSSLKTSISLLSLKAPSRATTWELAKHLAFKSGKSHLAIIPFPMFYELIQTCYNKMNNSIQEAQVLGNLILSKLTGPDNNINNNKKFESDLLKNNSVERTASASTSPVNSRCVIQVCEYLFACIEASLGGNSAKQENFTLLLDGVEEYIRTRKGGEAVMKDLISWVNLFESTGRNVILGLRMSDSITRNSDEINQDENDESTTEDDSEETGNFNNSSSLVSSKEKKPSKKESSASAFQMMTSLLLNAAAGNGMNSNESITPVTNVFISGSMMRLYLTPPKNDKRKQLKYNQIIALDRKKDRFDSNMNQLKLIAQQKWNVKLDLKLKSKYDFPSEHSEIWDKLSSAGRGLLTRENLIKDEFMEIIMSIMGESKPLNAENLSEAIDRISRIRHDPSQMSSEDLNSFLSERQVSMNSLTKYEKRFINCISTSTTQTHYKDITLPVETMGTLKSLTTLPLTHPELFTQGILKNSLTGVLLFGPPGTGKTMLARAVAQESGATFLAVNMSNIFDMYVGEGEKNVKGMFSLARKLSPTIIFIDEIDALLERRSSISGRSSRLEIVNEFMSQWDGLSANLNSGVIVMGATNRPFVLDDAVLRRLPRRILVDLPDTKSRLEIVTNLLKENLCEISLLESLPEIASKMEFYSGSDLKNVAITAALKAANRVASSAQSDSQAMIIRRSDFEEAIREVPASLSDQMESLMDLRQWNQMYGETRRGEVGKAMKKFGFA